MELISTFLASGLAVAFVSVGFEVWRDRLSRKENVRHLALRIAFNLEGFAIECANLVNEHRYAGNGDGQGQYLKKIPQLQTLPESSVYTLIKADILEKILDFPQRCQMAERDLVLRWQAVAYEDEADDVHVIAEEHTIKIGELAVRLAKKIRGEYKLSERDLTFGNWDVGKFLSEELEIILKKEAQLIR